MSKENNIPKHWQIVKLRDICKKIVGGGTPSTANKEYWEGDIPWISSADIYGLREIIPRRKISKEAIENSATNLLPKGGIIVVTRVGLGKLAIAPYEICFSQDSQGLVLNEKIISQSYALIYLSKAVHKFKSQSRGTTISGVTKKQLEELIIPLPPLPEQLAIVSKIEELLSDLENGKQQLQTTQQQLKIYRQSLLKWAFEGKLSQDHDSHNLPDDHDLKKKSANDHDNQNQGNHDNHKNHSSDNLPKGWKWVKLADVCNKIQDGSHFSPLIQYDEPGENRFMYITAKNIRNNYMDLNKLIYVDKEFHNSIYGRCNPEYGDVLLTKDGVNTGEIAINTLHEPFSLLSSVCIFKTNKSELKSEFLKYFIQSPFGSKVIANSMTGTAIKRIILRKIKDALIILPSISEQQFIVDELETKLTVCDKIEETIKDALQQSEILRQSILKKAFTGQLIKMS
ncbi:MAG TPA: restriction endonuclease subunit S [Cyclobacteriaceae bacterium]|nr:restriction endonuclease subunit S [Cyclobacteriaceae bacterium]